MAWETELARILRIGRERARVRDALARAEIGSACVLACCLPDEGEVWYDERTAAAESQFEVAAAVAYLEARGLLDRHPEHEGWVRLWLDCSDCSTLNAIEGRVDGDEIQAGSDEVRECGLHESEAVAESAAVQGMPCGGDAEDTNGSSGDFGE